MVEQQISRHKMAGVGLLPINFMRKVSEVIKLPYPKTGKLETESFCVYPDRDITSFIHLARINMGFLSLIMECNRSRKQHAKKH